MIRPMMLPQPHRPRDRFPVFILLLFLVQLLTGDIRQISAQTIDCSEWANDCSTCSYSTGCRWCAVPMNAATYSNSSCIPHTQWCNGEWLDSSSCVDECQWKCDLSCDLTSQTCKVTLAPTPDYEYHCECQDIDTGPGTPTYLGMQLVWFIFFILFLICMTFVGTIFICWWYCAWRHPSPTIIRTPIQPLVLGSSNQPSAVNTRVTVTTATSSSYYGTYPRPAGPPPPPPPRQQIWQPPPAQVPRSGGGAAAAPPSNSYGAQPSAADASRPPQAGAYPAQNYEQLKQPLLPTDGYDYS